MLGQVIRQSLLLPRLLMHFLTEQSFPSQCTYRAIQSLTQCGGEKGSPGCSAYDFALVHYRHMFPLEPFSSA
jgi:hypothetical protein